MSKFIIIEGPDFCGKTTQLNLLKANTWYFDKCFYFTREPGSYLPQSSLQCEKIRERILSNNNSPEEEAELFAQSRYFHTKEIIELMQEKDCIIISDRYIVSSLAYQGYAQKLGKEAIYGINQPVMSLLKNNNIEIHCVKFIIDEDIWDERRESRLANQAADSIEQKNIHKDILNFFINDEIFNNYTNKLNMKIYELDASANKTIVFMNFVDIIKKIINS